MLDALNEAINSGGGDWIKLTEKGQKLTGALQEAEVRRKTYKGKEVLSQKGHPRHEWVLTLMVDGEPKYVVADEGGQSAIRAAARELGRNLTTGDVVTIHVTESSEPGEHGPEWDVTIRGGSAPSTDADDAPPF